MEALAWHQLWPSKGLIGLFEVIEFIVDNMVPGGIRIPVWLGWDSLTRLPGLPDLTTLVFSECGRKAVTHAPRFSICPGISEVTSQKFGLLFWRLCFQEAVEIWMVV